MPILENKNSVKPRTSSYVQLGSIAWAMLQEQSLPQKQEILQVDNFGRNCGHSSSKERLRQKLFWIHIVTYLGVE